MKEITFKVFEAEEGGDYARAVGASIFTQTGSLDELYVMIQDAIACHYDEAEEVPQVSNLVFEKS